MNHDEGSEHNDISLHSDETEDLLSKRQLVDYKSHRKNLIKWMLSIGKDQGDGKGYAYETTRRRAINLDAFYRWVWANESNGYTKRITHDYADAYTKHLRFSDHSDTHKSNLQKSVLMLFKWREYEFDDDRWEPSHTFSGSSSAAAPKDYFTKEERTLLREAALEYGSVPHYNSISPQERTEWKRHLAHRTGTKMENISKENFEKANGFKIPSLVNVSLDAGLRPIEVASAKVSWVDLDNCLLRIPAEEAAKNADSFDGTWMVSLTDRTVDFLERWLDERELYSKYDDTEKLWLTRHNNPYQSTSLKYLLGNLCDLADISPNGRSLTWYAIRHSTGTYMSAEGGLADAQAQLRHISSRTTVKYDQTPPENRKEHLNKMG